MPFLPQTIKHLRVGLVMMDPFTVVLAFFLVVASGTLTWWIATVDSNLRQNRLEEVTEREKMSETILQISNLLLDMNGGINAILYAHPGLKSLIDAHKTLDLIEASVGGIETSENQIVAAEKLLTSIRGLLATVDVDGDLVATEKNIDPGMLQLSNRIYEILTQVGLGPADLGLSDLESRRLGELAYRSGHRSWALSCFEEAARLAPGEKITLRALEHLSTEAGDDEGKRIWLEARLRQDPDNPELLRTHAHLLAQIGDPAAERDVLRLEALGLDTAADRSLLSGLRARAGASSEALEALDAALEADPSRSSDWLQKALLHDELDEPDNSIKAVERCLLLDRQNGDAWALQAKLLSTNSGKLASALKSSIHAVALNAGGTELILLKADLLTATGKETEGRESLAKALQSDPNNDELRASMAAMSLQDGDPLQAESLLRSAPTPPTMSVHLQIQWGRLHLAFADLRRDGSGETDKSLLSVAGDSFRGALNVDRESGIAWLGLARVQRLMKDLDVAEESLTRARRLMNGTPSIDAEAALLALDLGDLSEAQRLIESASVKDSENAVITYVKGNISASYGRFKEALEFFTETIKSQPSHVRARLNRASVYMALDKVQEALDDCEILLNEAPELILAEVRRGEALMMLSQWSEAKNSWEKVIGSNPRHSHALTQLAACHMSSGRPELAESPLNEALGLNPESSMAWHQRGLLYLDWSRDEAAISDFKKAVATDPTNIEAQLHIAAIYHEAQNWNEAEEAWRNILSIDPEHTVARRRFDECTAKIATSEILNNC